MTLAATIVVKKVYDNGKSGKVVDQGGGEWKFWKESKYGKAILPDQFPEGATLAVGYKVGQWNGKEERTITAVMDGQSSRPVAAPAKPQAKELQREKSPKENENIFVNGKLSAAISAGAVEFQEDALVAAGKMLQRVYARLYKPINIQQTEIEMDDEIPGFGQ